MPSHARSTTGRNRGQNPAAAALASQTQRQKKHFVEARKLLAKRLKRCGPHAATPAPLPTQPAQPAGELPSQLPVELDIHAQIKTAVKTVLQLDGLGQTLTEVRRQVSSLLGVDCASGTHMARVDQCVNKYLTKRRTAAQAEEEALRAKPTFARLLGLFGCSSLTHFQI